MEQTRIKHLGWGAYGVAFLLIAIPVADSMLSIWPLRVGDIMWRFGAVGLFSRAVMTPLFGLLVGLVTASYLGHRVVARLLSIVAFLGAGLAMVAMGFFVLDALQTRGQVRPEAARAFDAASAVAMVKYFLGAVVALALGVGGWKGSRVRAGGRRPRKEDDTRVIVSAQDRDPGTRA